MAKKNQVRGWVFSPGSQGASPGLDKDTKAQIESRMQEFIDKELKPRHVKPPAEEAHSNYLTDIKLKWHGTTLFLVAVYACPGPNAIAPTFEDRFARLRPAGSDRFDLSYLRHTGQWIELYQGQTIDGCLEALRKDPSFFPIP